MEIINGDGLVKINVDQDTLDFIRGKADQVAAGIKRIEEKPKLRILVVDDRSERQHIFQQEFDNEEMISAYSYDDAVRCLTTRDFDVICLDHDLGDDDKTGYDIVKFITENNVDKFRNTLFVIHTMNYIGGNRMAQGLNDVGLKYVQMNNLLRREFNYVKETVRNMVQV